MATAIQLGLVPGFAEQDGDQIARLLSGGGAGPVAPGAAWGLGNTTQPAQAATGNNNFGTAAPITASVTALTTVTGTNNSVTLPQIVAGTMVRIFNTSANVAYIFPPLLTQHIDTAGNGQSVFLSGAARCDYMYMGNNAWLSSLLGSPSA